MSLQRRERVAQAIREEVSRLLQQEIKDPRIGFVSVVRVQVSGDLRYAKVFASVYGDEEERLNTLKGLQSASGFLRSAIAQRLGLRRAPEIRFILDESIAYGARITTLLHEAQHEAQHDAGGRRPPVPADMAQGAVEAEEEGNEPHG